MTLIYDVSKFTHRTKCSPLHEHDCDKCMFLGQYDGHDLYFCLGREKTLIARNGPEGDYSSGSCFAQWNIPLFMAYVALRELQSSEFDRNLNASVCELLDRNNYTNPVYVRCSEGDFNALPLNVNEVVPVIQAITV